MPEEAPAARSVRAGHTPRGTPSPARRTASVLLLWRAAAGAGTTVDGAGRQAGGGHGPAGDQCDGDDASKLLHGVSSRSGLGDVTPISDNLRRMPHGEDPRKVADGRTDGRTGGRSVPVPVCLYRPIHPALASLGPPAVPIGTLLQDLDARGGAWLTRRQRRSRVSPDRTSSDSTTSSRSRAASSTPRNVPSGSTRTTSRPSWQSRRTHSSSIRCPTSCRR